jgi:tetratricopeptide (TPR) repeat protein
LNSKHFHRGWTRKPHEHKPNAEIGKVSGYRRCLQRREYYQPSTTGESSPKIPSPGIDRGEANILYAHSLQAGGDIHLAITQGIATEQFQRLAHELGVTNSALTSFFKILEQQHVPLEDLDAKLREIATHYQTLLVRVRTLSADDPQIAQLRDAAETAIHAGDFTRAEALLNETSARDLAAAQELQDLMTTRLLGAAEAKATNGALKMTQLAYADAAAYYRQAAALVEHLPAGSEERLARFLSEWGGAAYEAGDYRGAEHPLTRALAICEAVLGAQHPDVAASLNNLAELYRAQGRYEEAAPLYQRALAICEAVLGAQHPDVAASLNNLAELYDAQGRYEEAAPLYQRALAIYEAVLGAQHPNVAVVLENYAALLQAIGCSKEAENFKARAQTIRASHI